MGVSLARLHVRLIAHIAISTSTIAVLLLLGAVLFATDEQGTGYAQLVKSHVITRQNLDTALLVAGLCLLALVMAITWLVSLYASFRVAGPMFRFCRNLEGAAQLRRPLPIREEDSLHEVSEQLIAAVEGVRGHYAGLDEALVRLDRCLEEGDEAQQRVLIGEIKEQLAHVRLD